MFDGVVVLDLVDENEFHFLVCFLKLLFFLVSDPFDEIMGKPPNKHLCLFVREV